MTLKLTKIVRQFKTKREGQFVSFWMSLTWLISIMRNFTRKFLRHFIKIRNCYKLRLVDEANKSFIAETQQVSFFGINSSILIDWRNISYHSILNCFPNAWLIKQHQATRFQQHSNAIKVQL